MSVAAAARVAADVAAFLTTVVAATGVGEHGWACTWWTCCEAAAGFAEVEVDAASGIGRAGGDTKAEDADADDDADASGGRVADGCATTAVHAPGVEDWRGDDDGGAAEEVTGVEVAGVAALPGAEDDGMAVVAGVMAGVRALIEVN